MLVGREDDRHEATAPRPRDPALHHVLGGGLPALRHAEPDPMRRVEARGAVRPHDERIPGPGQREPIADAPEPPEALREPVGEAHLDPMAPVRERHAEIGAARVPAPRLPDRLALPGDVELAPPGAHLDLGRAGVDLARVDPARALLVDGLGRHREPIRIDPEAQPVAPLHAHVDRRGPAERPVGVELRLDGVGEGRVGPARARGRGERGERQQGDAREATARPRRGGAHPRCLARERPGDGPRSGWRGRAPLLDCSRGRTPHAPCPRSIPASS